MQRRWVGIFLWLSLFGFVCAACADEGHHHELTEEEVGLVHFSTSCSKKIGGDFNHAVALLHSFQYEATRHAFTEIAAQDPRCAMAQWGIAMSHYHGLWENGDTAAGRAAVRKAQAIADANASTTSREKAYIEALAEVYREDGEPSMRAQAFEQKMAALQTAYPDDSEAAIFHALTLAITAPKSDKTFSNQRKCGEILEPIFAKQPHHPGIAHYLIHCYDNPVLASQGLDAARMYAKIAPASAHANHMPSHIFTRVGSWDESIASNLRSAELAAHDESESKNGEARDQRLHAMDYLEYAYLQSGQVKQAKAVLDQMKALPSVSGLTLTGDYALSAIPARYVVELGLWKEATRLEVHQHAVPWAQAIDWMVIGIGSAQSGDLERANLAEKTLVTLRDLSAQQNPYWSKQVEVQRQEVAAWIANENGKEDAMTMMRAAAELEESMDKHAVTPGSVTPAREMLAEMLMQANRPGESLAEYEAVLSNAPNRFNAIYGAAMAADAAGKRDIAQAYYKKLTEIAVGDERPELITARKKVMELAAANSDSRR